MRARTWWLLIGLLALSGCGRGKSTPELIADLKAHEERDRIAAVRTLPQRTGEAAQVVPALVGALQDRDADVRLSAAIGLGAFGPQAREAISALQGAQQDRDVRVRRAAGVALSRIDPGMAPQAAPAGQ